MFYREASVCLRMKRELSESPARGLEVRRMCFVTMVVKCFLDGSVRAMRAKVGDVYKIWGEWSGVVRCSSLFVYEARLFAESAVVTQENSG